MAKYHLTNKAVEDLSDIWDYTYDEWSEDQADKYYSMLINSFQEIAERPFLGKIYEEVFPSLLGLRVSRHIVFYRKVGSSDIEIIRVLHERMDLKRRTKE